MDAESKNAESFALNLDSWADIERFRIKFIGYDDGFIGQGVSDAVGKLLVSDFKTFIYFSNLYGLDFNKFVFKHIDSTISENDLHQILQLTVNCNELERSICQEVNFKVKDAISDL